MQEYNYEFKENVRGVLERLEKKIPFAKIDIEHLDLESKVAQNARQSSGGLGQR
jgi:TFIIF-interacting CTD phosphatase-like protein